MTRPRTSAKDIEAEFRNTVRVDISNMSRAPFRHILALLMENHPSPQAIRKLAKEQPERWAMAVNMFERASGYASKQYVEHQHNVLLQIQNMSDAEIEEKYQAALAKATTAPLALEGEVISVSREMNDA